MFKRTLYILSIAAFANSLCAQSFLNGSFETNTAGASDQINLTNAGYNAMMANSVAFGSFGDMDIIKSATWGGGGAQNGTWYVALTGAGTDAFSLKLAAPLVAGTSYTISFYDRADGGFAPMPVQIGLNTVSGSFGTTIFTSGSLPVVNVWTNRVFSFVAPNNGQYITVQLVGGALGNWSHVDNFTFLNVLPIQLGNFDAMCKNNKVELDWKTVSELNNDHFTIERSEDGIEFASIGTIKGAGNSYVDHSYSFLDERSSSKTLYYRLKQNDENGNSSVSDIIAVGSCANRNSTIYQVMYNANIDAFIISSRQHTGTYEISVLNALGEIVFTATGESPENFINASLLSAGSYLIRITGPESVFMKKVFKN